MHVLITGAKGMVGLALCANLNNIRDGKNRTCPSTSRTFDQKNGNFGIAVLDYVDKNVSDKVIRIIQSYTGVVNKMVWRKP